MADVIEAPVRELRVVRTATGEVVHRVDVTGQSDRFVEKCLRGLLTNMNREEFHVEDSRDKA
jgi:curli biogenesis system outer membrane secretion channel CsgG